MKRIFIILSLFILLPIMGVLVLSATLYLSADMLEPPLSVSVSDYEVVQHQDTTFCHDSYLYQAPSSLWELYVEGSGAVRGAKQGALTKDLMRYQEDVFIEQIRRIIPSDSYLGFLRYLLIIFNRDIAHHIDVEYREEIAAMSLFCTDEYNAIGTPYERQLNYHAAHDIGHTMQQYMLVGCSSFALWGDRSEDGELLVGRNFDFYVGDDFAKNKIITFAQPDSGYRYASIGWAGMVGVLSGINEQGLTVTINAAQGAIPTSAKTPISILCREILQYASTIEEAYAIVSERETFVNESIMIASRRDGCAAIIEKTPLQSDIYYSDSQSILSTNHYQSSLLRNTEYNRDNILNSDSQYRYDRLSELLEAEPVVDYREAVEILRNRYGAAGEDVGIGNEMTLNQSIAHHSVVFAPSMDLMWVSTSPWQSGEMVCYDLSEFFESGSHPAVAEEYCVEADTLFMEHDLPRLLKYRESIATIGSAKSSGEKLSESFVEEFLEVNPHHYYTYRALGDYFAAMDNAARAKEFYASSLECSIPYRSEREEIEKIIEKL
ncbi:MAG: C45 family peptidase [Rikenellaceae bacterium]